MLWHVDIKTTMRVYGSKFNESHALCRVEEFLDRRDEEREHLAPAAADGSADLGTEADSKQLRLQPKIQPRKADLLFRKTSSSDIAA